MASKAAGRIADFILSPWPPPRTRNASAKRCRRKNEKSRRITPAAFLLPNTRSDY
jgi:hypothetical protein